MEKICKITGARMLGGNIQVELQTESIVKEKIGITQALKDIEGYKKKMMAEMTVIKNPDILSIPIEDFNLLDIDLGDIISVTVVKHG